MILNVTQQELATILAALQLWQDREEMHTNGKIGDLMEIATNGASFDALDSDDIDRLCEAINI